MSDILNEKVDLSALNLGSFTLSALLGAVVTFCICVIAMRLILSILRRMLDKTRLDATLRKYALGAVRLVLWVIIVLIVADQLGIPVTSLVALLSVVSLAVSLAVQSVLSNIAGRARHPRDEALPTGRPRGDGRRARHGQGDQPDIHEARDAGRPVAHDAQQRPLLGEDHELHRPRPPTRGDPRGRVV